MAARNASCPNRSDKKCLDDVLVLRLWFSGADLGGKSGEPRVFGESLEPVLDCFQCAIRHPIAVGGFGETEETIRAAGIDSQSQGELRQRTRPLALIEKQVAQPNPVARRVRLDLQQ